MRMKQTSAIFFRCSFLNFFTKIVLVGLVFFFVVTSIPIASAAPRKGFEAKAIETPKEIITLAPGETKTISLSYKNIGKTTWKRKGAGYVSFYTAEKNYRKSIFESPNWFDATHASLLKEATVKPGATGTFKLVLHAPKKEGTYTESFGMVAEDTTWIPGGELKLEIEVGTKKIVAEKKKPLLSGIVLIRSTKQVTAEGGEQIVFKVGMKNTGTVAWTKREVRSADSLAIASVSSTPPKQLALNTAGTVEPGAIDFLSFMFVAPPVKGVYTLKYQFAANDVLLPEAEFSIPVEVTSDAEDVLNSPILNQVELQQMIPEPVLRIGVLIVDEETNNEVRISCNTDWKLMNGSGIIFGEHPAQKAVTAFYKNDLYYFNQGNGIESTTSFLRFVPNVEGAVCKIENFDKRVTRRAGYAENTFRNILELRYNTKKNRTWVINEVKMEEYLAGLGETSELSDHEFKKTLITIARTYALYHWERATKHKDEFFHMNASADDQVYRGYEYEMNNPSIGRSANETRGSVVTFEGKTAITPYFSRSDGRTRDWGEVWHGTVAWIKSVPCPCDASNGRKLWGHGVGLSASEALCMAKSGQTWETILKYFYQGIELKKRWN